MKYNVGILGGGPAGYSAAFEAAERGLSVVLFEKEDIGGTCVNRGCVPTKYLSHTAELFAGLTKLGKYGISVSDGKIEPILMRKTNYEIILKLRKGLQQKLEQQKIVIVGSKGKIVDRHHIIAEDKKYDVENIIIATGARTTPPFIEGAITTDELLKLDYVPEYLKIIGGGVIAVEFADIYSKLGSHVTMCLRSDRLLRKFDKEISVSVTQYLKKHGIQIVANCSMEQMKTNGNEVILSAIGRTANTQDIIVEEAGLDVSNGIIVDSNGRTNIPGIYAVGDVVKDNVQLAHVAMEQGRRAIRTICGEMEFEPFAIVNCIYMQPEVAVVGLSEAEARGKGIPVVSGKQVMSANVRTVIATEERGFIKIIAQSDSGIVIGAQLMCERASDLIAELALAINQKLTVDDLLNSVRPHPSYCEAITDALWTLKGKLQ